MTHGIAPKRIPILMIILVSYLMIILDISIVITALPKIQDTLGFSEVGLSWVQNAYTLTFGGLLLLGARGGDLLGRRRLFIIGLAIFAFASLLIGFTQSAAWMIASRALQGHRRGLAGAIHPGAADRQFPRGRGTHPRRGLLRRDRRDRLQCRVGGGRHHRRPNLMARLDSLSTCPSPRF